MTIDWSKVAEQAMGVAIGGGLTLAGIWVKEMIDRGRNSQSWYEETYITNGVDPVISYLKTVELQLGAFRTLTELSQIEGQPLQPLLESRYQLDTGRQFPFDPLIRLGLLLSSDELIKTTDDFRVTPDLFSDLPADKRSLSHLDETLNDLRQVVPLFCRLREQLLERRIRHKTDIHQIKGHTEIQAITRAFKSLDEELGLRDAKLRGSSSASE